MCVCVCVCVCVCNLGIVGDKEQGTPDFLNDVSQCRQRNGHTVVGGCASTEFVQYHQRSAGDLAQYVAGTGELVHEGGHARGEVVSCSHASEDIVQHTKASSIKDTVGHTVTK